MNSAGVLFLMGWAALMGYWIGGLSGKSVVFKPIITARESAGVAAVEYYPPSLESTTTNPFSGSILSPIRLSGRRKSNSMIMVSVLSNVIVKSFDDLHAHDQLDAIQDMRERLHDWIDQIEFKEEISK